MRTAEDRRAALHRGARAESEVASALEQRGFTVLARNYRARGGELDLVVEREGALRFVEVKARAPGDPSGVDALTAGKRAKLVRAAEEWLSHTASEPREACFLVALVELRDDAWRIEWIDDAFDGS